MKAWTCRALARGMTNAELRQVMAENPAKALGIAPLGRGQAMTHGKISHGRQA